MTIEYLKCNFLVKIIFPKVPSRGVKVGQNKKYWHFKVLQSDPCWYSKLVSWDAWFNGFNGLSSIGSSCVEKTSEMCQNIGNCQNSKFSMFFFFFFITLIQLSSKLFYWIRNLETQVYSTNKGHFGALKNVNIFDFDPRWGDLRKNILTWKLYFWCSIVIEHQIKHLAKLFSTKRGEWHTLVDELTTHLPTHPQHRSLKPCGLKNIWEFITI